jgi:hypothetical protein
MKYSPTRDETMRLLTIIAIACLTLASMMA